MTRTQHSFGVEIKRVSLIPSSNRSSSRFLFESAAIFVVKMTDELHGLASENLEFFRKVPVKSGRKLHDSLSSLIENVELIVPVMKKIEKIAVDYDFDEITPGNGFHSFVDVCLVAAEKAAEICKKIRESREKFYFRQSHYEKYVDMCVKYQGSKSKKFWFMLPWIVMNFLKQLFLER